MEDYLESTPSPLIIILLNIIIILYYYLPHLSWIYSFFIGFDDH